MKISRDGIYIRSLLNWLKLFGKRGYWNWQWLVSYGWQWVRPAIFKKRKIISRFYNLNEIAEVRSEVIEMGKRYPLWWPRVFEPETLGIRSWEYGNLLKSIKDVGFSFKDKEILDIGTGGSLLPDYLVSMGAIVTCVDRDKALEERMYDENIKFIKGDMTKLPFRKQSFDLVLCISALEHLDMKNGYIKTYKKSEYQKRAIRAIKEMKRVTKKGGLLYLTTDFYKRRQKKDNWPLSKNSIKGAFEWKMISMFKTVLGVELDESKNVGHNYRGNSFTTIAFWWRKV